MEMHFEKSLKAINIFQFYFCSVISEHKIIYARIKNIHLKCPSTLFLSATKRAYFNVADYFHNHTFPVFRMKHMRALLRSKMVPESYPLTCELFAKYHY